MIEYIIKYGYETTDTDVVLHENEFAQELIRCKECENHTDRTGRCDIWDAITAESGFCHRARKEKKTT